MKIRTLKPSFSGIKTVVYYKWSSFIPTNSEKITDRDRETLIKTHGSSDFYYSGGNSSDFLTFSEYDFKLNPEKEDLKGFVKSNYFDSETLELAKDESTNNYSQDILINFEDFLLPQISKEKYDGSRKFFGTLTNESYSVIYLDIPGDENESPVWMVELYEDFIDTNHSILNKKKDYPFIPYEVLEVIYPEKIKNFTAPNNIIKFGPDPNHVNNFGETQSDYSFYYRKNLDYYLIDSSDYIKLPEDEWSSLYREITSKEILKIVISPEGLLSKVINLSRFAWDVSKNPNRNQNKYSLRNDEFWATRDYYSTDYSSSILKDKRSGSIISTRKVESYESLPVLNSKLNLLGKKFSPRKVYKESDTVLINDYVYSSLISGNLGENPVYSNNWRLVKYYEPGDENKYVDNYQESLSLTRSNLSADYYQTYVHVNNKNFGRIVPSGAQYFRKNSEQKIYIYPVTGYKIEDLIVYIDGKRLSSQKKRLLYSKSEHAYFYRLPGDINELIDIKILFSPQQRGIIPYSIMGLGNSEIMVLTFNDIKENTVGKNLEPGFDIEFVDAENNNMTLTELEITVEDDKDPDNTKTQVKDLLKFEDSTKFPVRMYVSDELSQYSFLGFSIINKDESLIDIDIIETEINNENDSRKKLKYVEFEDSKETLNAVFKVQPKSLDCHISSDYNIELSSLGSYVKYSQGYSFSFAMANKYVGLSKVKFNLESWEFVINEAKPFCFKYDENDPNSRTILDGKLVFDESTEVYTLTINRVLFSIDIYVESLDITSLN